MNRYVAEGVASDLESGSNIALFVYPYNTVANVLHQVTEYTDEEYTQVRMGERSIYHESGGKVTAYSPEDALRVRGIPFDTWVIPHGSAFDFPSRFDPRTEIIEY